MTRLSCDDWACLAWMDWIRIGTGMVFDGSGRDRLYARLLFTNISILITTGVSGVVAPLGPRLKTLRRCAVGKYYRNQSAFQTLEAA